MFNDPGCKLKKFAKVTFWINVALSPLAYIGTLVNAKSTDDVAALAFAMLLLIAVWLLVAYGLSLLLYGIGELIESNDGIESNTYTSAKPFQHIRSHPKN